MKSLPLLALIILGLLFFAILTGYDQGYKDGVSIAEPTASSCFTRDVAGYIHIVECGVDEIPKPIEGTTTPIFTGTTVDSPSDYYLKHPEKCPANEHITSWQHGVICP